MKITINKGTNRERNFEISQNELDEMFSHVHSKGCYQKLKNLLIDLGANQNAVVISMYDIITMTPDQARIAVYSEFEREKPDLDFVKNILEHSVIDINYGDTSSNLLHNHNLLHLASGRGNVDFVKLLLERPEIDVNMQDNMGITALMFASRGGHKEIVKLLLERPEIDVNLQTTGGWTALQSAFNPYSSLSRQIGVIELLLKYPRIDAQNLTFDIRYVRNPKIRKLIFNHSMIDINKMYPNGENLLLNVAKGTNDSNKPICKSTRDNKIKDVAYLLKHPKIDVSIKNKEGKTAWDVAPDYIKNLYPKLKPSTQS